MQPLVSIILPTYNDRRYLQSTIESVLAQSLPDFELIVVDDGSTDGSDDIYRTFSLTDHRVRYVRQTNQGLSAARNTGIGISQGKLIAFLDSDDVLHPDFLRFLVDVQQIEMADVVICQPDVFPDGQHPEFASLPDHAPKKLDGTEATRALLRGDIITNVWNRLYKRELLQGLYFHPGIFHEDLEFSARLFPLAKKVVCLDKRLYGYRKRSGSILSTPKPKLLLDRIQVVQLVYKHLKEADLRDEMKAELQAMAVIHLGYYGMKDLTRSPRIDWTWLNSMKNYLIHECGVTPKGLRALPVPEKARKWVRFALAPSLLGRTFLLYQHWRAHRE